MWCVTCTLGVWWRRWWGCGWPRPWRWQRAQSSCRGSTCQRTCSGKQQQHSEENLAESTTHPAQRRWNWSHIKMRIADWQTGVFSVISVRRVFEQHLVQITVTAAKKQLSHYYDVTYSKLKYAASAGCWFAAVFYPAKAVRATVEYGDQEMT